MKILIINGPNLNLLGTRDTSVYGTGTLEELNNWLTESFSEHELTFFQSNVEGELINRLQQAMTDGTEGIVGNFAAYTHTSVALADAIGAISTPIVEVHISNIHAREAFREKTLTGSRCKGIISGLGLKGYELALNYFMG